MSSFLKAPPPMFSTSWVTSCPSPGKWEEDTTHTAQSHGEALSSRTEVSGAGPWVLWGSETAFSSTQDEANFSICFLYFENIFLNFQSNAVCFEKWQYYRRMWRRKGEPPLVLLQRQDWITGWHVHFSGFLPFPLPYKFLPWFYSLLFLVHMRLHSTTELSLFYTLPSWFYKLLPILYP